MRAVVLAVTALAGDVDAQCVYTDDRWVRPQRPLRTVDAVQLATGHPAPTGRTPTTSTGWNRRAPRHRDAIAWSLPLLDGAASAPLAPLSAGAAGSFRRRARRFGYEPSAGAAASNGRIFRLVMTSSTAPYSTACSVRMKSRFDVHEFVVVKTDLAPVSRLRNAAADLAAAGSIARLSYQELFPPGRTQILSHRPVES
jgi:hypothetical protein